MAEAAPTEPVPATAATESPAAAASGPADAGNDVVISVEATYNLVVPPEEAFEAAREAVKEIHTALDQLQSLKANDSPEVSFDTIARGLQLQLLALRRAHRSMAKAADAGRVAELAARKSADAEHAHLETRQYESACCRAAARRCRSFPTPQLSKLRPQLKGWSPAMEEEQEEADNAETPNTSSDGLAARLDKEKTDRSALVSTLEGLQKEKAEECVGFRNLAKTNEDIMEKLRAAFAGLEPVSDTIQLRPRPASAAKRHCEETMANLSSPLRLIFSKFDMLAAFSKDGSIGVKAEVVGDGPAEKKAKTTGDKATDSMNVRVEVTKTGAKTKSMLVFTNPVESLVTVAVTAGGGDDLLQGLWPEDDGTHTGLLGLLPVDENGKAKYQGRPYVWAQILAGLRERVVAAAPPVVMPDSVTASEVVLRVRPRLKA